MHRRARHLNPRDAGATLALDSRRISGLNDGDRVGSWTDSSRSSNTPTQSTVEDRPIYKTAIQGGQPVVRFDGYDALYKQANLSTVNELTIQVLVKFNNTTSRYAAFDAKTASTSFSHFVIEQNTYNTAGQRFAFYTSSAAYDSATATNSNFNLISAAANTTANNNIINNTTYKVNGAVSALTFTGGSTTYQDLTALNGFMIGAFNNDGTPAYGLNLGGDLCYVTAFPAQLSNPLLKRLEHAAALSFKIACS